MRPGMPVLLGLLLALCAAPAGAAPGDPSAAVGQFAASWLRQQYQSPGAQVLTKARAPDARLPLAPCAGAMAASLPQNIRPRSRMSVLVRCTRPDTAWSVRVPVSLQLLRPVLVTSRPLQRGDGLGAADVHVEQRDVTRLGYGYIASLDQIATRTLAHALPKNSVLSPFALGGRQTVRAGDAVQVLVRLGSIEVRADGVALAGGDRGARVRVRNASTGRVLDTLVTGPGTVQALP